MSLHSRFFILTLACAALAACTVYNPTSDSTSSSSTVSYSRYAELSPIAPPTPKYESKPMMQHPQIETWKAGYWSYDSGSFSWVPGEIVARPSPTAVWSPPYWIRHNYGWALVRGYWQ